MTKKQQINKNLKLTEKFASYILDNPSITKGLPKDASYVSFSSSDPKLNAVNNKIVNSLLHQGTAVVKVEETKNTRPPWKLTLITL